MGCFYNGCLQRFELNKLMRVVMKLLGFIEKKWKGIFTIFAIATLLTSCSALYFSSTVNQAVNEQKLLSFESNGNVIMLRTTSAALNYLDQPKVNLSYIITIPSSLSSEKTTSVYLRLTDAMGFEIVEVRVGNVAQDFTGSLKGSIELDADKYEQIKDAEIFLRTPVN